MLTPVINEHLSKSDIIYMSVSIALLLMVSLVGFGMFKFPEKFWKFKYRWTVEGGMPTDFSITSIRLFGISLVVISVIFIILIFFI